MAELSLEKVFIDFLKKVAPGTPLRLVINDLIRSRLGALIVFSSPELEKLIEGGFRVNCRFTPQRLFELCKMDGAIVISSDLKRILHANVLLTPDSTVISHETGTRHKAAERTAKQANTFVIAISERRRKTTLYYQKTKYYLKSSEELLRGITSNLQFLEKQREIFDDLLSKLNILEMSDLVSVSDVCRIIQRAEIILRISETIKRNFTELGKEGNIMNLRHKELLKNVEKIKDDLIRDYSKLSLNKSKKLIINLTFEGLIELETLARLLFEEGPEESVYPKGYRFMSHLSLNEKEISVIASQFSGLNKIIEVSSEDLEPIIKGKSGKVREEINNLREQILSGKIVL